MDSLEKLLFPIILISKTGEVCFMNGEATNLFKKSLSLGSDFFSHLSESSKMKFHQYLNSVIQMPSIQECNI